MWICIGILAAGGAIFSAGQEIGRLNEENRHLEKENKKLKRRSRIKGLMKLFGYEEDEDE